MPCLRVDLILLGRQFLLPFGIRFADLEVRVAEMEVS